MIQHNVIGIKRPPWLFRDCERLTSERMEIFLSEFHTTEPQSGRAEPMEMWAERAAETTSLWLWHDGSAEETRTALCREESNAEASAAAKKILRAFLLYLNTKLKIKTTERRQTSRNNERKR